MTELIILFSLMVILFLVFFWVLISVGHKPTLLFIAIPAILLLIFVSFVSYSDLQGYPTHHQLPENFYVWYGAELHHKEIILLTTTDKNVEPRLYSVPYSKSLENSLLEHADQLKNGIPLGGKSIYNKDGKDNADSINLYTIEPQSVHPKSNP